ncbi:5-hydroxytryptamine receptor 1A-alpha [Dissostichus eleginoides]|nr:5-hydroxytryptamine receptor 1A-alpha [Dissostichus eleginoides]
MSLIAGRGTREFKSVVMVLVQGGLTSASTLPDPPSPAGSALVSPALLNVWEVEGQFQCRGEQCSALAWLSFLVGLLGHSTLLIKTKPPLYTDPAKTLEFTDSPKTLEVHDHPKILDVAEPAKANHQFTNSDDEEDETLSQISVEQCQPDSEGLSKNKVDVEEIKAKRSSNRFYHFFRNIFSKLRVPTALRKLHSECGRIMDFITTSSNDSNATSSYPHREDVVADWDGGENGTGSGSPAEMKLSYQIITSLLLGALILCSIFGNACVVAAIALERSLQNVANYLIGSLAVTDLMVSVLVLPMAALYQVLSKWTLGQEICDLFISLDVLCCTSSILHLCAIALDRYWAITDPIDYVNKRTPRRAAILISVTWLIGFSISIPPMLGWRRAKDRANPDACSISQDPGYTIYSTFGAFYIPLILMLVLYGRIFKAARFQFRKTVKKVKKVEKAKVSDKFLAVSPAIFHKKSNGEAGVKGSPCVNGAVKHGEEGESLEIIEVMSNSKTHLPLPNTPQSTHGYENMNDKNSGAKRKIALAREQSCYMPDWLFAVINWLGYSNSLLNPIIYAYFNKDFQSAFKKIIRCKFHRA